MNRWARWATSAIFALVAKYFILLRKKADTVDTRYQI